MVGSYHLINNFGFDFRDEELSTFFDVFELMFSSLNVTGIIIYIMQYWSNNNVQGKKNKNNKK